MLKAKKRWQIQSVDNSKIDKIIADSDIHPLIAGVLSLRGVNNNEEANDFLSINDTLLHDPYLFRDMKKVVERIQLAIIKNDKILIYGDYDADGVTSTALLYNALNSLGANVSYYIPNRFSEGYGLNKVAIEKATSDEIKVIITVDTGISAIEEAELAKKLGITLIITDHHEPQETLPDAYAIINPKTFDETYPFKYLAGVGVAFKLTHALLGRFPKEYIDIVSLGTIADLVPLIGENRIIANLGLKAISQTKNIGLKSLLKENGLIDCKLTSYHVGFILAPRINAAGRLDSSNHSVDLLITNDYNEAEKLSNKLSQMNHERQALVKQITKEVLEIINLNKLYEDKVIVVAKENWNTGVIGIVASSILEKYYKPTIILSIDSDGMIAKGSARSIEGFDVFHALSLVKDILITFGGHTAAAGLSVHKDNISLLREKLNVIADEWLTDTDFIPIEKIDATCNLEEIDIKLIEELNKLEPFGIGNPKPRILINNVEVAKISTMGAEKKHLKLNIRDGTNNIEAVYFNNGDLCKNITDFSEIDLVTELNINEWKGNIKPQLLIRDLQVVRTQIIDWRNMKIDDFFNKDLIDNSSTAVFVDKKYKIEISNKIENCHLVDYNDWKNLEKYDITTIVLVHLPPSILIMEELLKNFTSIDRIYCLFDYSKYNLKPTIISRDLCKKIYISLLTNEKLRDIKSIELFFSKQSIEPDVIKTVLSIFVELDFIKISNSSNIQININSEKKELSSSILFNECLEQEQIIKIFLLSNHQQLIEWFLRNIK